MLKISLDEAYVFDMLAILNVKLEKIQGQNKNIIFERYKSLSKEISDQIGQDLFHKILKSDEFKEMIIVNKKVFELIDSSKEDMGLAKTTDEANHQRHLKKVALQNKFFDYELTEIKNTR